MYVYYIYIYVILYIYVCYKIIYKFKILNKLIGHLPLPVNYGKIAR